MNDRSSTSNSNYYNQSLHLTDNPSLTLIQEANKKEKRKKASIRKNQTKETSAQHRKESNMTPTRGIKNFSPILHFGKYPNAPNAASPTYLGKQNRS